MTFWKWSKTAAANATADGTINWAEGMAPSAVNDSARSMMAAVAKWRDDIEGAVATGGTATAFTLTSNQAFDTLANMNGHMVALVPHATNTGPCTLNVDGLGAKALRSAPGVELLGGTLILGTPYVATYRNSTNEWLLHGFYGLSEYSIPLGGMIDYTGPTTPSSRFVFPFGQAISRSTYATYFALIGTAYGTGDGSTTFNVPDLRGRFTAAPDNMGGSVAGRIAAGTSISLSLGSESKAIAQANLPNVGLAVTGTVTVGAPTIQLSGGTAAFGANGAGSIGVTSGPAGPVYTIGSHAGTIALAPSASFTGGSTSSINGGVTQSGLNILPPTLVLNKILRVL